MGYQEKYLSINHHGRKYSLHASDEEAIQSLDTRNQCPQLLIVPIFGSDYIKTFCSQPCFFLLDSN
jgi:hypothetical protein